LDSNLAHLLAHDQLLNDKGCLTFTGDSPAVVSISVQQQQ